MSEIGPERNENGMPSVEDDWYAHAFAALYPVLYAHRTVEAALPEAEFAIRALDLAPDRRVLDLCCGPGRHMVHLAGHVQEIVGFDFSRDLLAMARERLHGKAELVRGDMRALPFRQHFDAVVNFFTSFGYFTEEEDNQRVACEIANVLKPNGQFFIDFMNRDYAITHLVPYTERAIGNYDVQDERWIDVENERLNKRTSVLEEGRLVNIFTESVRLYSVEKFATLLTQCGLKPEFVFGDYKGSDFGPDKPRMIIVGSKS